MTEYPGLGNQYQCNSKLKLAPNVINMYKTIPSTIQTFAMPSTREKKNGITAFASYVMALMKSQPAKDICSLDKLRFTAFEFKMGTKQNS